MPFFIFRGILYDTPKIASGRNLIIVIGVLHVNRGHKTIFGYEFSYGVKWVHFKMIVAHWLIKLFKIKYKSMRPILLGTEKYTRQNLPRHRWHLCDYTFLKQFMHFLANNGVFMLREGLFRQSVLNRGNSTLNTRSQNIRQEYSVTSECPPSCKMSSHLSSLKCVA